MRTAADFKAGIFIEDCFYFFSMSHPLFSSPPFPSLSCHFLLLLLLLLLHPLPPSQGELVEGSSIHRSVAVECMQWHPEKTIIAIGWRSGEITTYSDSEHESFEQSSVHRAPLVFVVWNASGNRLISGDKVQATLETGRRLLYAPDRVLSISSFILIYPHDSTLSLSLPSFCLLLS